MPRRFTFVFLAVLATTSILRPATAQRARDDVQVRMTTVGAWAAPDRPLTVGLSVSNTSNVPVENLSVRLTIYDRVRSRSALRSALDGKPSGEVVAVTTEDVESSLGARQRQTIDVQRDLGPLATAFRPGRAISGVYPIAVRVQAAGTLIADRFTAFVFLAQQPEKRLNAVWLLPLTRPPAFDGDGAYNRTQVEGDLLPRVEEVARALAAHPEAPVTLAPAGLLVDSLADLADGFELSAQRGETQSLPPSDELARRAADALAGLRAAVSPAFDMATMPYARATLVALMAADLASDAARQIALGRDRVEALTGRRPSEALLADGTFSADARNARTLAAFGARTMILTTGALRSPRFEGSFGPDRPIEVSGSGVTFQALLSDDQIRQRLESATADPVLTAQAILAETASAYFELPAIADGRLVVLASTTMPDRGVVGPLLDGLAQAPWLGMLTASQAATAPQFRQTGEPRPLRSSTAAPSGLSSVKAARRAVGTLDQIAQPPGVATASLDRLILASESADFASRPTSGSALAQGARSMAERALAQIRVPFRRVTLTARGGQVPVTIENKTPYPVRLLVRLDSPKVTFPDGTTRTVDVGANRLTTLTFAVKARAAGSFPIGVILETREGGEVIRTSQVVVRSTAVSAVTLMATAGGALFLLGAWARRGMARRAKARSNA